MNRDDLVITAIRNKDFDNLIQYFFNDDISCLNYSYRTETELWDYKQKIPSANSPTSEWAELAKDVLAFHNTRKGGVIIFGISDSDYSVVGIDQSIKLDSKIINDKIRGYVGDLLWVELVSFKTNNSFLMYMFIIPPLSNQNNIRRFLKNGPQKRKKLLFEENGSAIRKKDSSCVLSPITANSYDLDSAVVDYNEYEINELNYRLLSKEYHEFILREKYCAEIERGINYSRAATVSLIGIGGVGKTALATWAVKKAYDEQKFDYIISISAKDRELTSVGIQSINQKLTTLDDLLNAILEVLQLPDYIGDKDKLNIVVQLISGEKMLLFVDNLETTSDAGIINFINNLPDPVKAIVTSRRNVVTCSTYPILIEAMNEKETVAYISSLANLPQNGYCQGLSETEKITIGNSCNGIPLAIKWLVCRCNNSEELLTQADQLKNGGYGSEELLEFSFRRVLDSMNSLEREIMQILAVSTDITIEAVINGCSKRGKPSEVFDSLHVLNSESLVFKYFDKEIKADRYRLMDLTKKFMLNNIPAEIERRIQRRLGEWFAAKDIQSLEERKIVSAMRQSGTNMGDTLVEFAENSAKRGDFRNAEEYFNAAIARDSTNWRVYWKYGEFFRHSKKSITKAIEKYELAIGFAGKEEMSMDIAKMYREFGIIYCGSGAPNATNKSIQYLEIAAENLPNDPITAKILATLYEKLGYFEKIVEMLQPFVNSQNSRTKEELLPILLRAYENCGSKYYVESVQLRKIIFNS